MYFAGQGAALWSTAKAHRRPGLVDGTSYRTAKLGETDTMRFPPPVLGLDPNSVCSENQPAAGINEKSMAELKKDALDKVKDGTHRTPRSSRFSRSSPFRSRAWCSRHRPGARLPVLGEGKLARSWWETLIHFRLPTIVMFLSESLTQGGNLPVHVPVRWCRTSLLGAFGSPR
jgi:hypothetical protein